MISLPYLGIFLQIPGHSQYIIPYEIIALWPDLLVFKGMNADGESIRLIQHMNAINLVLTKVKRQTPKVQKTITGFTIRGVDES